MPPLFPIDFVSLAVSFSFLIVVLSVVGFAIFFVVSLVRASRPDAAQASAPEMAASGMVVAKRIETAGGGESPVRQTHYVTFEQPGGTRFELQTTPGTYGLVVEGDRGVLTIKGSQLVAFAREIMR